MLTPRKSAYSSARSFRLHLHGCAEVLAKDWGDTAAEDLDGLHHLRVRKGGDRHLERDAVDAAKYVVDGDDLFGDCLCIANHQRSAWAALLVVLAPGRRAPAALRTDL